jgi:hypothetical protein
MDIKYYINQVELRLNTIEQENKMNNLKKVLLISLAPNHSSAVNRLRDATSKEFKIDAYQTDSDKVQESIAKRIFSFRYPKMFVHLIRSDADLFWAWGLDACIVVSLAALLRPKTILVWDITDINSKMLNPGIRSAILRFVEKLLIKRANELVLSSPAFYTQYYNTKIAPDKVTIIENLLPGPPPAKTMLPLKPLSPFRIVYSGIIRSFEVLRVASIVAKLMPQDVELHIHGYLDRTIDEQILDRLVKDYPNIYYHGRFETQELERIYGNSHISWGFVDANANDNERWLLNNRIYNGICFGRPVLGTTGTTSGRIVEERSIGISCNLDAEEIVKVIRDLLANNGDLYHEIKLKMPSPSTAYLDGHYRRLITKTFAKHGLS